MGGETVVAAQNSAAIPGTSFGKATGDNGKKIVLSRGKTKITFSSKKKIDDKKTLAQLINIFNVVAELNQAIPQHPIKEVTILDEKQGWYRPFYHKIGVLLDDTYIETVVHEMGHAIFAITLAHERLSDYADKDDLWNKIYFLSLTNQSFRLLYDADYTPVPNDSGGHPWDSPTEMFASLLVAYRLYGDKFKEKIVTEGFDKLKCGLYAFVYIRDKIFKGKMFINNGQDSFSHLPVKDINISDDEILDSLTEGFLQTYKDGIFMLTQQSTYSYSFFPFTIKLRYNDPFIVKYKERFIRFFSEALIRSENGNAAKFSSTAVLAIDALRLDKKDFIPFLLSSLKSKDSITRQAAAIALENLDIKDASLVDPLREGLKDPNLGVRLAVLKTIDRLGISVTTEEEKRFRDKRFVAPLIKALNDRDSNMRSKAAEAIGSLLIKDKAYIKPLLRALHDSDPYVRSSAVYAVILLGFKEEVLVSPLSKLLFDPFCGVRVMAAGAVGALEMKKEQFINALAQTSLRSDCSRAQGEVLSAMGRLGVNDKRFYSPLYRGLVDNDDEIRQAAATSLGLLNINEPRAITLLLYSLADPEETVRLAAIGALGKVGGKEVIPALQRLKKEENQEIVQAADEAIKRLKLKFQ